MSKKLDETLAIVIQSVLAADPAEGKIGTITVTLEDAQGVERTLLLSIHETFEETRHRAS